MGVFFFVPGRTITDGLIDAYKIISAAKSPDEKTHWCVIFRIARNDFWRKPRPVPSIRSQQFANVGTKKPHAVLLGVSLVTSLTITTNEHGICVNSAHASSSSPRRRPGPISRRRDCGRYPDAHAVWILACARTKKNPAHLCTGFLSYN
jgi:hypothetical protein